MSFYFPLSSFRNSTWMRKLKVAKWSVENVLFGILVLHVICYGMSSPSSFFGDWLFFYGVHFTIEGRQKATFWKSKPEALSEETSTCTFTRPKIQWHYEAKQNFLLAKKWRKSINLKFEFFCKMRHQILLFLALPFSVQWFQMPIEGLSVVKMQATFGINKCTGFT